MTKTENEVLNNCVCTFVIFSEQMVSLRILQVSDNKRNTFDKSVVLKKLIEDASARIFLQWRNHFLWFLKKI